MVTPYEEFPTWEDLVKYIIEEDGYDSFSCMPGDEDNIYWILDNEFWGDGRGGRIDDWVFTKYYVNIGSFDYRYEKLKGYPTLEEALEAKIFNGESIHDLYNRGHNWDEWKYDKTKKYNNQKR
jgi:hypothetical protein